MAKIAITKDVLDSEEYFDRIGLPHEVIESQESTTTTKVSDNKPVQEAGRPPLTPDSGPRKQRRVLPRSGEPTSATLWGIEAQEKISKIMTPVACDHYNKSDARALSKSEVSELEYLKLCIFTGMQPMIDVTPEVIQQVLKQNTKPSQAFENSVKLKVSEFTTARKRKPNNSEMKHIYAAVFAQIFCFGEN
jgi:hypothetical protein